MGKVIWILSKCSRFFSFPINGSFTRRYSLLQLKSIVHAASPIFWAFIFLSDYAPKLIYYTRSIASFPVLVTEYCSASCVGVERYEVKFVVWTHFFVIIFEVKLMLIRKVVKNDLLGGYRLTRFPKSCLDVTADGIYYKQQRTAGLLWYPWSSVCFPKYR